ncbi:MAG: hypothetical protein GWM98_07040, partial [Nitrospinaceae bacterium]|nr:1-acyl-sn-glycerol-3-phosphate acyltransferase [Nitrospinaceae bacterium]NIR54292.1 1-acyl-sn-glycerol-3-phosphate acyltransferase [Nitrospinaceae bacterium]NIS84710.1 1-acyl-sn-glycerol-3-phosphate acyltransferase [Nitrospinaceae bacterium]NIT81511.1 1-acyl-sn-glycerol-3-phosphate acyltransferase [Nitrospinaceae bacterium]NIX36942.1 hypothetical protein [Nitrospinaceae bacterium]
MYGGRFFQWLGAYPTRPGTRDYEQSLAAHIEILSCGRSIQIFPEGKKSIDGVIRGPARGGVAFLSWRTNTPVVPVAISGAHRTTLTDFFLRRKRYRLTFGKPIMPK